MGATDRQLTQVETRGFENQAVAQEAIRLNQLRKVADGRLADAERALSYAQGSVAHWRKELAGIDAQIANLPHRRIGGIVEGRAKDRLTDIIAGES